MRKNTRRGRPPHDDLLTPAEWNIVHAVQHGMTSEQIAKRRRQADGTEEWMAFFKDPEGRPLALMAQVKPALQGPTD